MRIIIIKLYMYTFKEKMLIYISCKYTIICFTYICIACVPGRAVINYEKLP